MTSVFLCGVLSFLSFSYKYALLSQLGKIVILKAQIRVTLEDKIGARESIESQLHCLLGFELGDSLH